MPPARTGVADYSAALIRALSPLCRVELNAADADVSLYHIGNNQLHREIYQRALEQPGVAVLHDAVLHHSFLGSLSEPEYVAEFMYNYGAWNEDLAHELWHGRAHSATDPRYFRYPMLKRIAERSLAIVVHNPRAADMAKEHAPGAVIHEIPHLFEPPQIPSRVPKSPQFLFGVFGHLRESKRLATVLRAFARARRSAEMSLLVAGEFASSDLARSLEPLLAAEGTQRIGYTPERDFWRHTASVDACINLRYPNAGETSGIAIRLMGIGKPVILSDTPENSRWPDSACLRVDTGLAEEDMLVEFMIWLARFPSDAQAIGERAAAHIHEFHAPAKVAALYYQALKLGVGCNGVRG